MKTRPTVFIVVFTMLILIAAVYTATTYTPMHQAQAWEMPTPIRTADDFPPLVVGRITVPVDFGLYVNAYYNFAHSGLDGMMSNFAAISAAHADQMERLSAVLDDFQALDTLDFQNSMAIHKVSLRP